MRACIVGLLLLFAAGCGTLSRGPRAERDFALSPSDHIFAQALSHCAQGLILEQELGRSSPEAMEEFAKAAKLDPGKQELHAKAAVLALQSKLPDRAITILQESCRANPGSVQALLDLASVYEVVGKQDKAIELYSRIIKLDKTCTFAYLSLARLYFNQNEDVEALGILRDGMKDTVKAPAILAFCHYRGKEFITNGEIQRAIPCFEILESHSPSQRAQFSDLVGDLYQSRGDDEQAIRHFTLATLEASPLPESFVKLALIQLKYDPNEAIQVLLRADRLLPPNAAVLFLLGFAYSAQDRFSEAIKVYDRVLPVLKESEQMAAPASFYLYYGSACERAGQADKAESIFEKCIERYPDNDMVLNYLAYMWAEKGVNLDKAEGYVVRALKQSPDNGAYIDTLGWILFKKGKYRDALNGIQKASELIKDDPVVTDHLGDVFGALADKDKAIACWKHSLLLDPQNKAVAEKLRAQGIDVNQFLKENGNDQTKKSKEKL